MSHTSAPVSRSPAEDLLPMQSWLQGPLFEHKIFSTLSLLMRNLSEQFQDYRTAYYNTLPDQFLNGSSSVQFVDHHALHHHSPQFSSQFDPHETDNTTSSLDEEALVLSLPSSSPLASVFILCRDHGPFVLRLLLTILCACSATWAVNRSLLRRNRLIQYAVELVLCHLIILPTLPFIGLFYAWIGLMRLGIWVHIQIFHRGKRYLVDPEDGFWAFEELASSSASIGLYFIKGKCDPDRIREKVKEVIVSPVVRGRMKRRFTSVCGFAVWEDVDKINIRQHIRIAKWPKSMNEKKASREQRGWWTDKDVLDYMTTFQDRPLCPNRPAWEVIIIPNVRMGDGSNATQHYACIFRVHHAVMDGISSANILHQVLGDKPFKFTIDPIEGAHKRPGKFVTACMYLLALILLPRTGLVNGFLSLDNKYNRYFSPGKTLRGPKHFAWSRPLKMDAVKKIKDLSKTSVMSVLLAGLGGSYRKVEEAKLLKKKCVNGDELTKQQRDIPEYYHALAPVAMLPYPDRHPRNGFSGVPLPVAVGEYAGIKERLQANHKAFKQLNVGIMDILGNFILIGMVGLMPTRMQKLFGAGVHFRMSLSNIPGSEETITIFGGDSIVEMGAWLPCKFTLGMAMGMFSYGGRCRATMVGDNTYLSKSEVESLVSNFETEISDLGKSLGMEERDIFCEA